MATDWPTADADAAGGLALIVLSGAFERVHYALVLASAAAAIGRPVILFFTLEATRALVRPASGDAPAGWAQLAAADGSGGEADAAYRRRGVAGFEELLAACVDLGVRVIVCEMGLRALDLSAADLRDDVPCEVAGVVTLLAAQPPGGAILAI